MAVGLAALLLPQGAMAGSTILDEVRFGVFQHDTNLIGVQKELGVDYALEILTRPIIRSRLLGSPRLVIGGAVNSAGRTNQIYAGFVGRFYLFRDVVARHDGFFFEGTVGADWNDGKLNVLGTPLAQDWKSHGSHFLIRSGLGAGYRFDETWSATLNFNHISNAGLAYPNEGSNDLGLSIGMKI